MLSIVIEFHRGKSVEMCVLLCLLNLLMYFGVRVEVELTIYCYFVYCAVRFLTKFNRLKLETHKFVKEKVNVLFQKKTMGDWSNLK